MEGRCQGLTLSGEPCQARIRAGRERCWQHTGPQCSVCLAAMGGQRSTRKLDCGHEFHERCLDRWKMSCTGPDPTCPMCRAPFDVPVYRCRLTIDRVADNHRIVESFETTNVASIVEGFGIDFRTLVPPTDTRHLRAEILFDIDQDENISEILRELGLPIPRFD
jgi:hypothetical protein